MQKKLNLTNKPERVLCWFSCGAASAVAAHYAIKKYGNCVEVCYCDTLAYEHPDNVRFLQDVQDWLGVPIRLLQSTKFTDIYDVFQKTRYLVGPRGARCTTELKKLVRIRYQRPDDVHVFGFTVEEAHRAERFRAQNLGVAIDPILIESGVSKQVCLDTLQKAGIALPAMYRMGYKNNNCIGCVKGGKGYWNKIRQDFPDIYYKMAAMERELGVAINSRNVNKQKFRVFLDELNPMDGDYAAEPDLECGVLCQIEDASGAIVDNE